MNASTENESMSCFDIPENETDFIHGLLERSGAVLSPEEMKAVSDKTVAQAGFGGVGALAVELLARWGIKRFRLLDMDRYDVSNMNRQIYATVKTVGQYKAEVAAKRIAEINPFARVEKVYCESLNHQNTRELLQGADVVIRAADLPAGTLLLHHYASKYKIPLVTGHCHHVTGGLVRVFDYRSPRQKSLDEPTKIRWINNILYKYFGIVKNEIGQVPEEQFQELDERFKTAGTLNFVTNLLACLVVSETVKLLLNKGRRVRYPREIYIDLFDLKMRVRSSYDWERICTYLKRILRSGTADGRR